MARLPNQHLKAGTPKRPANLSEAAAKVWDRLIQELQDSGVQFSTAHGNLIAQAATIAADIAEAWETVQEEGAYIVNSKSGATCLHPAAKRLDGLRRDLLKVLSLIGLRSATAGEGASKESLDDILNG